MSDTSFRMIHDAALTQESVILSAAKNPCDLSFAAEASGFHRERAFVSGHGLTMIPNAPITQESVILSAAKNPYDLSFAAEASGFHREPAFVSRQGTA